MLFWLSSALLMALCLATENDTPPKCEKLISRSTKYEGKEEFSYIGPKLCGPIFTHKILEYYFYVCYLYASQLYRKRAISWKHVGNFAGKCNFIGLFI